MIIAFVTPDVNAHGDKSDRLISLKVKDDGYGH